MCCWYASSRPLAPVANEQQASFTEPGMARDFHASHEVTVLTISFFILGLGIGPLVTGPFSEVYGRAIIYRVSYLLLVLFGIPLAIGPSLAVVLVFRFLQGLAGASFLSVAGGSVADMFVGPKVATPMAFYTASPVSVFVHTPTRLLIYFWCNSSSVQTFGPAVAGFINQNLDWRWTFRICLVWMFCELVAILLFVPESYAPVLLKRKAARLRKETGDDSHWAPLDRRETSMGRMLYLSCTVPFKLLIFDRMALLLDVWTALLLGIMYLFFQVFPIIFEDGHRFNMQTTGLTFLSLGGGIVLALGTQPWWNRRTARVAKENGGKPPPETTLVMGQAGGVIVPIVYVIVSALVALPTSTLVGALATFISTRHERIIFWSPPRGSPPAPLPQVRAHNLRSNELRDLRAELIRIGQNPNDLTDASEHTSDSELDADDTILVPVPAHLAYHTYAAPLSPTDPYWPLFLPLPPSRPPTPPSLPANTGTTLQQVQPRPPPSASTMATQMPARGDRTAPHFDSKKPRELLRYFSDLEFLFNRASVTDNAQKKAHATRFLEVDDQDIWESLPEFTTANKTWDEFKTAVTKLYPGSDKERKFSMNDLDALIGEQGRLGILSRGEYGEFYRQAVLSGRAMISVSLWDAIHRRLQIKKPDVHPDDPYDIADMNEAAEFVLAGTSAAVPATAAHTAPAAPEIKQEPAVSSLVESLSGLIKILATQAQQQSAPRQNNNTYNQPAAGNECNIGAFVPSRIPGKYLKDRIDEWHRQNPGQLAAAQLLLGLAPQSVAVPAPAPTPAAPAFVLSESDRIQSLERELLALRTRAQARAAAAAGEPVEKPEQPIRAQPAQPAPPAPAPAPANPPVAHPVVDQPAVPRILTRPPAAPVPQQPEHPFAQARDAAYAPPRDRNLGARIPNPPAAAKKPDVAYRTTAPIYDEKIASEVFGRSMDAPVTLTQRELLSLSPEVRAQVRDATTSRRVASGAKEKASDAAPVPQFFNGEFPAADVEIFDTIEQQREKDARTTAFFDAMPATYTHTAQYAARAHQRVLRSDADFDEPEGMFMFAFTSYPHVHWIGPLISAAIFGTGMLFAFTATFTYLVMAYRPIAASAMAANSALRSTFGAIFPLFAASMYARLGTVGATALLAGLTTVMMPLPFIFYKIGPRLRETSRFAI
ncbi:hypothetical protein HMN09_00666700 [Mycena chlorophos]|uniref:DUF4100 domain-containing protein n=1 Tax=Mycena chlorophos TaxID=658473 RepID=A0A8H6W716_MYCCL|nr:hypothetical protein HMN09_00666700 [Mycena chlorophos]